MTPYLPGALAGFTNPSVPLYETTTISAAMPESFGRSATRGIVRTLAESWFGSPGLGPVHSHWTAGEKTPELLPPWQFAFVPARGPKPKGMHAFACVPFARQS